MKLHLRRLAAMMLVLTLLASVVYAAPGELQQQAGFPFEDVAATAWYCKEVSYAYANSLVNGVSATEYLPARNVKRCEFVTMLGRLLMPAGYTAADYVLPFTDVVQDSYYYSYVCWAASLGIVNGMSPTSFQPNGYITRQDMATILYRTQRLGVCAMLPTVEEAKTFPDADSVRDYAKDAVAMLQQQGLLHGDNLGKVNPKNNLTRAESAAMISRFHAALGGHTHAYVYTGPVAATCEVGAYARYACSCGSFYGDKTAPALGHIYAEAGYNSETGLRNDVCTRCGRARPVPAAESVYDGDSLLQYDGLLRCLDKLEAMYPGLISVSTAGKSVRGLDIPVVTLGRGSRYIFLNGNIHAREYISTNYLLEVLDEYALAYVKNSAIGSYKIRPLLNEFTLVVIPCANPDGRAIAIGGRAQYKNNANDVDLNRNFPIYWSEYSDDGYYGGSAAGSEPETQAILRVLREYPFELALDCHTAGNVIYYTDAGCSAAFSNRSRAIANALCTESGYLPLTATVGAGLSNYVRNKGDGIPGLTIEMWPTLEHPIDCTGFYTKIWTRLHTMPAIAMDYLRLPVRSVETEEYEHIPVGPEG